MENKLTEEQLMMIWAEREVFDSSFNHGYPGPADLLRTEGIDAVLERFGYDDAKHYKLRDRWREWRLK